MINLFKQNNGFGASKFVNQSGNIPDEIKDKIIKVEDSVYQDLKDRKLMWKDGELVSNPNYQDYVIERQKIYDTISIQIRITELKGLLAESDYRAIKYAEGLYTEEEYAPYKEQRQAYRDEINQLESNIKQNY